MGISPHLVAGMLSLAIAVSVFIARWRRIGGTPESQFGWAFGGAFGAFLFWEAVYIFYRLAVYHTLKDLEHIEAYIFVGGLAGIFCGFGAIYYAFKGE